MGKLFSRIILALALTLGFAGIATAQITIPNAFSTGQVISSSKINANYNQLGLLALNRTAPILQATLAVDTDATYDLGAVATRFRNGFFSGSLTIGSTFTCTGCVTNADIVTAAGIPYSKLTLTASVLDGDIVGLAASKLTWGTTLVPLANGGTNANLSATGGANQVLKQLSTGAAVTVGTLASSNLSDASNIALLNATNVFSAVNTFNAAPDVALADAGVGTKTLALTIERTGAGTSGTPREVGLVFKDGNNPSLISGITGIRENAAGNFNGGLGFYTYVNGGVAATTISNLALSATLRSDGVFIVPNGFRSANGSTSVPTGVATGTFVAPSAGRYEYHAYTGDALFLAYGVAICDGINNGFLAQNSSGTASFQLSLSGCTFQVTQTSGVTKTVTWAVTKVPTL